MNTIATDPINSEDIVAKLLQIKALGCKLSIDDFGTGCSSLSYLKHFPLDKLKIDQSFVRNLVQDSSDYAIIKAIIAIGHNLELKVKMISNKRISSKISHCPLSP